MQEHSYPDPAQLRAFAEEPVVFDDVLRKDLSLDGNALVAEIDHVEYRYRPDILMVETEEWGWTLVGEVSWFTGTYRDAFNNAMDTVVEDNHVAVSGAAADDDGKTHQYNATWALDSILIRNR